MKKIITIIICCFIICGCSNNKNEYYKQVSEILVNTLNGTTNNLNDVDKKDRDVVNNYISQITHVNQEVNVSDMLIKDNEHKTTESNTKDIYYKNNNCYIKYDKLKINTYDYDNYEMEPYQRLVCDGYYIVVYQSDFYPNYEKSKTNPIYNYLYKGSIKNGIDHQYIYKSTYDGSYLNVKINADDKINNIDLVFNENYNDVVFDESISSSNFVYLPFIIMAVLIILVIVILLKNKKKIRS